MRQSLEGTLTSPKLCHAPGSASQESDCCALHILRRFSLHNRRQNHARDGRKGHYLIQPDAAVLQVASAFGMHHAHGRDGEERKSIH